ncbi:outer membrane beta-barrel protein [Ectothiorhodospiraceae bacterium 2226]|nr:outer membrane beta-barrel protein [Ectothiorhodospiraceae bacterium 2226]
MSYRWPDRGAWPAVAPLVLALLAPAAATASEWVLGPRVSVSGTYDDNVTLNATDQTSASGVVVAPELLLRRNTEITRLDGRIALRLARYPGQDLADRDEGRFDVRARRRGERSTWGINALYRQDTTLRAAFDDISADEPGLDEPIADDPALDDPDLGVFNVRVRRSRLDLSPRWEYALDPRTSVNAGYRFQSLSYGDHEALDEGALRDSERHRLHTGMAYALTERTRLTGTLMVERLRVDDLDAQTDNYELRAGFRHDLRETLEASLEAGVRRTEFDVPEGDEGTSTGWVMDSGLAYRTDLMRIRGFLRRTVQQSFDGRALETDRAEVRVSRDLTSKLEMVLGAHVLRAEALSVDGTQPARNYYEVEPQLRWSMTEEWSLASSVRYRRNKPENGEAAESRALFLGVTYEPRVITLR